MAYATHYYSIQMENTYELTLMVDGMLFPGHVTVSIVRDDMPYFRDTNKLYWNLSSPYITQYFEHTKDYMMVQFKTISTFRTLFVWGEAEVTVQDVDKLAYSGVDYSVPGYDGHPSLHLLRTTYSEGKTLFTEDSWYIQNKGLVRLEQRIDGELSMIWELSE